MRIAHVIRRFSFSDWGGTEQVVWNLAKAQARAGHDVRIFATTALCGIADETVSGIGISRFRPVYPWWPMPKRLVKELDRKGGNPFVPGMGRAIREWKPDVIHCHAMARIAELCIRTAEKCGAACVISLHGGAANVPGEEAKSLKAPTRGRLPWGKMADIALGWTRRVPEDAGGITCVGADEYEFYKGRHPHVLLLPNGVDARLFATADRTGRMDDRGRVRVLCVARIDRQKNQKMLVEWLARRPEALLRLAGPVTQEDYRAEIKDLAAANGTAGRLSFAGALKPDSPKLLEEYLKADVFALPSRHEPFGITALEAWAAGVPVIASGVGGLGRLCAAHPGAASVFEPGSIDSFDAAYSRLLDSPELRAAQTETAKAAAAAYDWRTLAQRQTDFYAAVRGGRTGR